MVPGGIAVRPGRPGGAEACAGPPPRASARRWAAAAFAAYLALVAVVLATERGDPEWFVHFGSDPAKSSTLALARSVFGDDVRAPYVDGHDGQRYWVQARDPLLLDPSEASAYLDRPVYRSQRVLYPLLASPFGLLGDHALLYGMVAVNLGAIALGTWAAARLVRRRAGHRWAPLAFPASPVAFLSLTLVTADALAVSLVLVGLDLLDRRRTLLAGVALAAASLAKEPMVLVAAALSARALVGEGRGWREALQLAAPPVVAVAGWSSYVRLRLDGVGSGLSELTLPLSGYAEAWRRHWGPFGAWDQALVAFATLALACGAVLLFWKRRTSLTWAALPFAAMAPFLSAPVLDVATNPLRAVGPLLTLTLLEVAAGRGGGAGGRAREIRVRQVAA